MYFRVGTRTYASGISRNGWDHGQSTQFGMPKFTRLFLSISFFCHNQLYQVAPILKERMMNAGTLMVTFQPHKGLEHVHIFGWLTTITGLPNFWRAIISNPAITEADIDFCIGEMDRLGSDIWSFTTCSVLSKNTLFTLSQLNTKYSIIL